MSTNFDQDGSVALAYNDTLAALDALRAALERLREVRLRELYRQYGIDTMGAAFPDDDTWMRAAQQIRAVETRAQGDVDNAAVRAGMLAEATIMSF